MLIEVNPILRRLILPPARHHIQRQPPTRHHIDARRLLGQQRRIMKRRPHRHHQLQLLRHRSQRSRRRPRIQRRSVHTLNVVQIQLSNQRQVIPNLLRPLRQVANILPARLHPLVVHIAQPSAKHRQPESVSHSRLCRLTPRCWLNHSPTPASSRCTPARRSFTIFASASSQSANFANGSNPTTFGPSATKFDSALMS